MQGNSPRPTHAPPPTSECRWKRGRPVASSKGTEDLILPNSRLWDRDLPIRFAQEDLILPNSRLWDRDLPIRFAQEDPVALAVRQGSDQQSPPTHHAESLPGREVDAFTDASEQSTKSARPVRSLRFTPTTSKRILHSTSTTPISEITRQLHIDSGCASNGLSTDVRNTHADNEERLGIKQQNVEIHEHAKSNTLPIDESESRTKNTIGLSAESEYVDGQDHETESEENSNAQYDEEDDAEQYVPLTFQIPDDLLRATMLASPNTRASYWSTRLYRGPQDRQISTHYCRSPEVAERVARYFLNEKVVGFDVEWKPRANPASIKLNASLIQLACEDRVALFHISLFPGTSAKQLMPPTLKTILESPDIYKVGVAVKGDFSRLNKFLGIQARGVFELSRLYNDVELHATEPAKASNKVVSLAVQVLQHLQLPLYKGEQLLDNNLAESTNVRESDWSQPLDLQQIHYAAADAYAGFRLYHTLNWKRKQLRPVPPQRGLCDDDSKPTPRSKDLQKKPRVTRKSSDVKEVALEQIALATEQEQEQTNEAEGDDPVLEEVVDSNQLENPTQASASEVFEVTEDVASPDTPHMERTRHLEDKHFQSKAHKQVGRVNLSRLRDSDPGYPTLPDLGYPVLPKGPEKSDSVKPSQGHSLDDCPKVSSSSRDNHDGFRGSYPKRGPDMEEDEFADPKLEAALRLMDIDINGKLISSTKEVGVVGELADEEARPAEYKDKDAIDLSELNLGKDDPEETATVSTSTSKTLANQIENVPHTREYDLATRWAQNYLQSTIPSPESRTTSRIRATITHLRAYHIWHHQKLALDEVAKHLRGPTLSHTTVSSHIIQAIDLEGLDYEKAAVRDLLMMMPEGLRKGRWKSLAEKVGALS